MLVHGDSTIQREIIKRVTCYVIPFSLHKYASNVIERCIDVARPQELVTITNEICASTLGELNASPTLAPVENGQGQLTALQVLVRDRYGNYIIQRLLGVIVGSQLVMLRGLLSLHRDFILSGPYGKQLLTAVAKQGLRVPKGTIHCTLDAGDGLLSGLQPALLHKLGLRPRIQQVYSYN